MAINFRGSLGYFISYNGNIKFLLRFSQKYVYHENKVLVEFNRFTVCCMDGALGEVLSKAAHVTTYPHPTPANKKKMPEISSSWHQNHHKKYIYQQSHIPSAGIFYLQNVSSSCTPKIKGILYMLGFSICCYTLGVQNTEKKSKCTPNFKMHWKTCLSHLSSQYSSLITRDCHSYLPSFLCLLWGERSESTYHLDAHAFRL